MEEIPCVTQSRLQRCSLSLRRTRSLQQQREQRQPRRRLDGRGPCGGRPKVGMAFDTGGRGDGT
jgi:hypothetical protein